jgi:Flp pilus assembly protein TadB
VKNRLDQLSNIKENVFGKMSQKHHKHLSIKGKLTPFFFAMLFVILCATSIFLIHPVLYFLKYFAAFGLIIGILLIIYILKTDEL